MLLLFLAVLSTEICRSREDPVCDPALCIPPHPSGDGLCRRMRMAPSTVPLVEDCTVKIWGKMQVNGPSVLRLPDYCHHFTPFQSESELLSTKFFLCDENLPATRWVKI